jgi:hypothetical protein
VVVAISSVLVMAEVVVVLEAVGFRVSLDWYKFCVSLKG